MTSLKNILRIFIFYLLFLLSVSCASPSMKIDTYTATQHIAQDNFENGVSSYWYRAMNNFAYSGNLSTNYSVSPTHSYRFELHNTDSSFEDGIRAELEGPSEPPLQERIYNFSVYLPKGGPEDYANDNHNCGEVIMQWHNNPDKGEEWTRPSLSVITDTYSNGTGHYYLCNLWDDNPISTDDEIDRLGRYHEYDLGPDTSDKGRWVNWSFHVKWGWLASQNPYVQIYKDGTSSFIRLARTPPMTRKVLTSNSEFINGSGMAGIQISIPNSRRELFILMMSPLHR
jgi:hypothetical protein